MASRAIMRMKAGARKASIATSMNDKAKKQIPGHSDYLSELRRYHHFWDCIKSEVGVQKNKLSNYSFFDHHKNVVTSVEHMKNLREKGLIHPQDPWKVMFDICMAGLILYSLVVIPYRIGFETETTKAIFVSDLVIDFLFLVDVVLRFNTVFIDPGTELYVLDRRKIAKAYFQMWFWIDFGSSIPFDLIVTGTTPWDVVDTSQSLGSVRLVRILRLVRLLKIVRMLKLKRMKKQVEFFNISPGVVNMIGLAFQVTFVAELLEILCEEVLTTIN